MVVDTSAIMALLLVEPEAPQFSRVLADTPGTLMSAVTRVELSFVAEGRKGSIGRAVLENFLHDSRIEVVAVSLRHAEIAIDAFRRFGRGRHRAGLNIGDCFSYALAKATGLPLLFKGADFIHTDIRPALPSIR
jgi:ribonuclease VapC